MFRFEFFADDKKVTTILSTLDTIGSIYDLKVAPVHNAKVADGKLKGAGGPQTSTEVLAALMGLTRTNVLNMKEITAAGVAVGFTADAMRQAVYSSLKKGLIKKTSKKGVFIKAKAK